MYSLSPNMLEQKLPKKIYCTKQRFFREEILEDDLPSCVDVIGYVDPNKRIRQMQEAGIRIDAWNHAVYDFEHEPEDPSELLKYEASSRYQEDTEIIDEGMSAMELYREEMYRQYLNHLRTLKTSSQPQETQTEAPQKESRTAEVPVK